MTVNDVEHNTKKAIKFLEAFRPEGHMNIVSIDPNSGNVTGVTRPVGHGDLHDFIQKNNDKRNLYFTVNEPKPDAPDGKLKKEHIDKIHAVWIDADPDKKKDFAQERVRLKKFAGELKDRSEPPTYITDSGGGIQAFWLLNEPIDASHTEDAEARSRSLSETYETDSVHNVDRLMRIPFTYNMPTAKKKGRKKALATVLHASSVKGTRYQNHDFIIPVYKKENSKDFDHTELNMDEITKPVPDELKKKFSTLLIKNRKVHDIWNNNITKPSRSERDFTLCKELKWAGFTMQETAHIMWNFKHGKNKQLTQREITRCYNRVESPFTGLSDDYIDKINKQVNPLTEQRRSIYDTSDIIYASNATLLSSGVPLFKKLLDLETLAISFGPSNSGKSFLMLSMALHLAAGRNWAGYKCKKQMSVLYVATEAGTAFAKRVIAARDAMGLKDASIKELPFAYYPARLDLLNNKDDVKKICERIKTLEKDTDTKCGMVVIDTMSAAFGGGNENSSEDAPKFLNNMADIVSSMKVTVNVIHHTGKDESAGARGHSSLKGNVDTQIRIKSERRKDKYIRSFVPEKQRDDETGGQTKFGLQIVELAKDEDGDPITTCSVVFENDAGFSDVAPTILEMMDEGEKALYLALKAYVDNGLNPDITGKTPQQMVSLICYDIRYNKGFICDKEGYIDPTPLPLLSKPNKNWLKTFRKVRGNFIENEYPLENELNQLLSMCGGT